MVWHCIVSHTALFLYHCSSMDLMLYNPAALRVAKTLWSFGHSECSRVNIPFIIDIMSECLVDAFNILRCFKIKKI